MTQEMRAQLSDFIDTIEACDFHLEPSAQSPTWVRQGEAQAEKLVLWIHPRITDKLQGHLATTRAPFSVHLRLFDPDWSPDRVLPGHLGKGFEHTPELDAKLTEIIWPRALAWFEAPIDGETLMLESGRIPSIIAPGPLLEAHRRRANWLEEQGEQREAAFVRGVVAEIEALFACH